MNKWIVVAMLTFVLQLGQAVAVEWSPIKIEENTVREVDVASVTRKGPVVTFTARHTFANPDEYRVSRNKAKYLLIYNRANCDLRTLTQLATEAYDEKMVLISKQQIQLPQDLPVTNDSIDEAVLYLVCNTSR